MRFALFPCVVERNKKTGTPPPFAKAFAKAFVNSTFSRVSIASLFILVNLSLQILACSNGPDNDSKQQAGRLSPAGKEEVKIVAFGDSLTAGYGLPDDYSFPARLEKALREKGVSVSVVNAGISGDTSAGGLSRVDWTLENKPDIVILELGANDALRGLDPGEMKKNLDAIITKFQQNNVVVLLTGMKAPMNLGFVYMKKFDSTFEDLADKHDIALYPFFLEGVAGRLDMNQDDGMHPNSKGVDEIVKRIIPHLLPLVCEIAADCP